MPEDNSQEVLDLKKKVEELEDKLRKVGLEVPAGIEGLSKGSDKFSIEFSFETNNPKLGKNGITYWIKVTNMTTQSRQHGISCFLILRPKS
ncbi:hypothetical protein [Nitrosomonas communis]|uniref:Uncharacterized protein n=1 Tax=Nitrosomonas communis TaxID=44574 RepID=A0A1I4S5N9_9PROT|nr:hypothetical protein [Nitrosomonas communis]SFM59826.1 hypothetical protein SAMN05421863_10384 [Nitrosomonas communis]